MDTVCMDLKFSDNSMIAIDTIAVENEVANNVVDTMGNLLSIIVRATNIHDRKSGMHCAKQAVETYPAIKKFCADAKYTGTFVTEVRDALCRDADIFWKIRPHPWEKLLWRWVVSALWMVESLPPFE